MLMGDFKVMTLGSYKKVLIDYFFLLTNSKILHSTYYINLVL